MAFARVPIVSLMLVLQSAGRTGGADSLSADHTEWPPETFRAAYKLIATEAEWAVLDTLSASALPQYLRLFWKRRDPTPSTSENEFKKQFEERVETALGRYRTYSRPAPWDRRGEVLIRLGPPDEKIDSSFEAYYEKWYYFDKNLKLMFDGKDVEYDFVPFMEFFGEVETLPDYAEVRAQVESTHVEYDLPLGVESVDIALEWYPFRRPDGCYDVYVACTVPLRAIVSPTGWRSAALSYTARVAAFDSTLQVRWADSAIVGRHLQVMPRGALAQNLWSTILPPGFYVVTAEVQDSTGRKRAVGALDSWLVPFTDSVELDLSALVLAADVRAATTESGSFVRNEREIVPMPGHVFGSDQDVAFYHEVYNLRRDDSGICRYRIVYSLYDPARKERRVLATQQLNSVERQTFQTGKISHTQFARGGYILEVATSDLVAGQTRTALARLRID